METTKQQSISVAHIARRELIRMQARYFLQIGTEMALGADLDTAVGRAKTLVPIPTALPASGAAKHRNWKQRTNDTRNGASKAADPKVQHGAGI